jgi:acetyl esterase/lipase
VLRLPPSLAFFRGLLHLLVIFAVCLGFALGDSPGVAPTVPPAPTASHPAPAPHHPAEPPTFADVAYGSDPRQKLDIYLPPGPGPFPVIFLIHGGGWFAGDKIGGAGEPAVFTKRGAAVISIEYRFIADAVKQGITPPVAAPLLDARRALQFVRLHAADYKLDADRIVATGFSAGATSSLYLACEGEQANPNSPDPVERVSTKILAAAAGGAQTSIDPQQIRAWNPDVVWGYWACEPDPKGVTNSKPDFEKYLADRDKWVPAFQKYSPDYLVTKEAAPIYLTFGVPLPKPGDPPDMWKLVHSPLWGIGFQKLAQERGAECYLAYPGHPEEKYHGNSNIFLFSRLGLWKH